MSFWHKDHPIWHPAHPIWLFGLILACGLLSILVAYFGTANNVDVGEAINGIITAASTVLALELRNRYIKKNGT
jgi:hypothetical protein